MVHAIRYNVSAIRSHMALWMPRCAASTSKGPGGGRGLSFPSGAVSLAADVSSSVAGLVPCYQLLVACSTGLIAQDGVAAVRRAGLRATD